MPSDGQKSRVLRAVCAMFLTAGVIFGLGAVTSQNSSVIADSQGARNAPNPPASPEGTSRTAAGQSLETRIAVLEASVRDFSALATIFVGIVSLLVVANVGLSVWQVGSLAQRGGIL